MLTIHYPMLSGSELLAKVKELGDANKTDIVRACGYVKDDKVCFTAFYEALLEAKGISLATTGKKAGRKLSYKTKVQFNGNLMVGSAYITEAFKPGDEFEIKVSRNSVTLTAA
jgi:hypothetical protein